MSSILKWLRIIPIFSLFPFRGEASAYFIAIKKNEGEVLETLDEYNALLPPKDRFYADPFLIKHKGVNYLFFENYRHNKGVISYVIVGNEGVISEIKTALELPIHLSFPYLFKEGEEIYMVPETYAYRSISLYKSLSFPKRWKRERVLVQGHQFSDPILFKYEGYYWLFTAIHVDQLMIYYAKNLESPFIPHPVNRLGIKGRNAGGLWHTEGKLIRPTMDCSERYGRAMILKEIVLLTPDEFIEREVACIEPNWAPDLVGTHTFSVSEDFVAYDGERIIEKSER